MSTMNWQDALAELRQSNELPEGEAQPDDEPRKKFDKLTISTERKGRAGKVATIISGFTIADSDLQSIAGRLKSSLGTGGSARGGEILIQGDRRNDVCQLLRSMGYKL